jgi:hypothetical protein
VEAIRAWMMARVLNVMKKFVDVLLDGHQGRRFI